MSFVSGLLALTWFAAAIRSEKCVCFLQITSVLIITEGFFSVTGMELGLLLWMVLTLTGSSTSAQPDQYSRAVVSVKGKSNDILLKN